MESVMMLTAFDSRAYLPALVAIWNDACGASLAITQRFVEYNTRASTGAIQAGQIAIEHDQPIGFVLATALPNDPQTSPRDLGWIDAIAVAPQFQNQGIGSELLEWAESFLRAQGCTRARLGGSLRPFAPGLPVELNNEEFFRARGFVARAGNERVWDVARDLADPNPKGFLKPFGFETRPAQPDDANALDEFFAREFPNRWRYEFEEFLRAHAPFTNYHLLMTTRGIDGFARLTFENSERPIERFFPHALPRPWGQLGPIGISKDARGKGLGGALLNAALVYLRDQGVRGCIIDWTDLVDFYHKFGFTPHREYLMLLKSLTRKI